MRPIETICQDFWRSVMSRDWAGNVRELENFVARCIALGSGPTLRDEDGCLIPEEIGNNTLAETDTHRLASIERYTIVKALKETKGDKIAAARILGIGKTTIYRKLRQYRFHMSVSRPLGVGNYCCLRFSGLPIASRKMALLSLRAVKRFNYIIVEEGQPSRT